MKKEKAKRIYVGMSGGVDSSVSAALLKEQGHDVTGVFIRVWQPDWLACNWRGERHDAVRVAAQLGIPFQTLDLSREYKEEVVDYMIAEYTAGRTPNPDVMCNKHIKFGAFFNWAMKEGADCVATGHYARGREGTRGINLIAGSDTNKDQSYFLWTLSQKQLAGTLFPIGGMQKSEVRRKAAQFGLPTAEKKDSQGICFIGEVDMREFLKHYIKMESGDVLNTDGEIIGTHEGALLYTIGQRHGFSIRVQSSNEVPKYVVAKDIAHNTITVAPHAKREKGLGITNVSLTQTNWITTIPEGACQGRVRYRQPLQSCQVVETQIAHATVVFDEPQHGVAVGQSVVLYKGEECLGGGVIAAAD